MDLPLATVRLCPGPLLAILQIGRGATHPTPGTGFSDNMGTEHFTHQPYFLLLWSEPLHLSPWTLPIPQILPTAPGAQSHEGPRLLHCISECLPCSPGVYIPSMLAFTTAGCLSSTNLCTSIQEHDSSLLRYSRSPDRNRPYFMFSICVLFVCFSGF